MLAAGFKAVVACLDPKKLPASLAGRAWDQALLSDLPAGVDPCGEVSCTSVAALRLGQAAAREQLTTLLSLATGWGGQGPALQT